MASCTPPLQEALNDSISSGLFADTKIILYSRRDSASGTIIKPKTLYANGHVLRSVPYFGNQKLAESEPKDFSEPIDEDEQAKDYGDCSDSDLEDDEDAVDVGRAVPPYAESNESSGKGAVIKIHDIALITFQAFLMYLYTGHIEFAPYGSKENRRSRSKEIVSLSEDSIPRPSPKSIYRLADKYDVPPLKRLALDSIRNGLERCDIVEEVFNKYSSSHEEVRTMYATHLASVLTRAEEKSAQELWVKVDEKIDRYISGNLDHAMDATTLLWKLSKGNVNCPPVTLAAASSEKKPSGPRDWTSVDVALIKSIRKGVLFDRKYWARRSTTSRVLRPIYISSIVARDKLKRIDSLAKLHPGDECFDMDDASEDENLESSSVYANEAAPVEQAKRKEESNQEPVLTMGPFSCWKSLFFYSCTNVIHFAPIKSQGVEVRAQHGAGCSPRVIYSLATALEIEPLRDLALNDIRSKITPKNLISELFSRFASRHEAIARMQCELMYDKYNDEITTAEGIKFIESVPGGNLAHRAGALKIVLKEGLLNRVFLRCPNLGCSMHNNTAPYRSFGQVATCPLAHHSARPYLECAGCEFSRMSWCHTSCQGCKKPFK